MEKTKLGVIGTGMAWEKLHWPALQNLRDHYEVVAVCDTDIEKAKNFAQQIGLQPDQIYSDHRHMLRREDIGAVDVLVPIAENHNIAKDVIRAGKGLIAEKPLAATFEQGHLDKPPLGDIVSTVVTLIQGAPDLDFCYRHAFPDGHEATLDTKALREALDGVPLSEPDVLDWIAASLSEEEHH